MTLKISFFTKYVKCGEERKGYLVIYSTILGFLTFILPRGDRLNKINIMSFILGCPCRGVYLVSPYIFIYGIIKSTPTILNGRLVRWTPFCLA